VAPGAQQTPERWRRPGTYWRNFLAVQRAVSGAGEAAASGIVTPSALRGAVATQGRAAYAQGRRGSIGVLARAGERILKPLPTSGTAENLRALMATGTPAAALGAYMGNALGGGPGAALGAMVGSAVPGVARALKMTGPGQAYMANQLAGTARNILDPAYLAVPMNALGGLAPDRTSQLPAPPTPKHLGPPVGPDLSRGNHAWP